MSVRTAPPQDARTDGRPDYAALGVAPFPQVNLLPPEVRSRRQLGRTKIWLGIALLVVLLLIGLGYVVAALARASAADDLADAEAEVQRLMAQQAQYAEVPLVKGQIATAERARLMATETEVVWPEYIRAIQAVLPPGVTITQLATEMPGPGTDTMSSGSPLDIPNVGALSFMAQARTLPDMAAWMDGLDAIQGFGSATFTTATLTDDEGVIVYEIAVQVRVDESAFAHRFVEQPEAADGADDDGADDEAGED